MQSIVAAVGSAIRPNLPSATSLSRSQGGSPTEQGLQLLHGILASSGGMAALLAGSSGGSGGSSSGGSSSGGGGGGGGALVCTPSERTAALLFEAVERLTYRGRAFLLEPTSGVALARLTLLGQANIFGCSKVYLPHPLHAVVRLAGQQPALPAPCLRCWCAPGLGSICPAARVLHIRPVQPALLRVVEPAQLA